MWVIWFLSFAVVLFFDCFFLLDNIGRHGPDPRRERGSERFRSVSGTGRP